MDRATSLPPKSRRSGSQTRTAPKLDSRRQEPLLSLSRPRLSTILRTQVKPALQAPRAQQAPPEPQVRRAQLGPQAQPGPPEQTARREQRDRPARLDQRVRPAPQARRAQ